MISPRHGDHTEIVLQLAVFNGKPIAWSAVARAVICVGGRIASLYHKRSAVSIVFHHAMKHDVAIEPASRKLQKIPHGIRRFIRAQRDANVASGCAKYDIVFNIRAKAAENAIGC